MSKITSPNRCSFVLGKSSTDNIVVTQEMIHNMRSMNGKKSFVAVKVDLEKAYDRVRWESVREILWEAELPGCLIELVWYCISSVSMQIVWNGGKTKAFRPSRGVRQGDPISPYLFVLCMERLGHLIQKEVDCGLWKPIGITRLSPKVSHLFFTDDLVLLAEASLE